MIHGSWYRFLIFLVLLKVPRMARVVVVKSLLVRRKLAWSFIVIWLTQSLFSCTYLLAHLHCAGRIEAHDWQAYHWKRIGRIWYSIEQEATSYHFQKEGKGWYQHDQHCSLNTYHTRRSQGCAQRIQNSQCRYFLQGRFYHWWSYWRCGGMYCLWWWLWHGY